MYIQCIYKGGFIWSCGFQEEMKSIEFNYKANKGLPLCFEYDFVQEAFEAGSNKFKQAGSIFDLFSQQF